MRVSTVLTSFDGLYGKEIAVEHFLAIYVRKVAVVTYLIVPLHQFLSLNFLSSGFLVLRRLGHNRRHAFWR